MPVSKKSTKKVKDITPIEVKPVVKRTRKKKEVVTSPPPPATPHTACEVRFWDLTALRKLEPEDVRCVAISVVKKGSEISNIRFCFRMMQPSPPFIGPTYL